jgi:DNA-directed RNA polymerase specialized sigma24 family protein
VYYLFRSVAVAAASASMSSDITDQQDAFDRLPEAYAAALRLRNEQCTDAEIADQLGLEPEGVATLLLLAQAKLAVIRRSC